MYSWLTEYRQKLDADPDGDGADVVEREPNANL